MIPLKEVEAQLKEIGANYRFWGRPEIQELQHILIPGEKIQACVNGRYEGGFATFCATDQRLLLIDKKLFYLMVEDMRFDMITEVDYSAQLLTGTMGVCTPTKRLDFTTLHPRSLRQMSTYIQQRVMQIRQDFGMHMQAVQKEAQEQGLELGLPLSQYKDQGSAIDFQQRAVEERLLEKSSEPELEPESSSVELTELPIPRRRNPYMGAPLLTRRRIGRFGPITSPTQPID